MVEDEIAEVGTSQDEKTLEADSPGTKAPDGLHEQLRSVEYVLDPTS